MTADKTAPSSFTDGFSQGDTVSHWTCQRCHQTTPATHQNNQWPEWISSHRYKCPGQQPDIGTTVHLTAAAD